MEPSISALFTAADSEDPAAAHALFAALYSELHRVAARELARSGSGATLGATSLLHQAYLDMTKRPAATFPDQRRFMAYAARVMRGLVIDYVRNRRAQKRDGQFELTSLTTDLPEAPRSTDLQQVSDALDLLATVDPPLAKWWI
jgi:RNA polymerase sigma factor (TIGR02999 family)